MRFKVGDKVKIKSTSMHHFMPSTQKLVRGIGKIAGSLGRKPYWLVKFDNVHKPYWLVKFDNVHSGYYFDESSLERVPNTQLLFEFMYES